MPSFGDSDAIIFVTGGVTYAESQNLQEFVKKSNDAAKERASTGLVICVRLAEEIRDDGSTRETNV